MPAILLGLAIAISIHVPLTGDDFPTWISQAGTPISIHVPLTGDDFPNLCEEPKFCISIHVPLTGDDQNRETKYDQT